jgi:hypothetical protein
VASRFSRRTGIPKPCLALVVIQCGFAGMATGIAFAGIGGSGEVWGRKVTKRTKRCCATDIGGGGVAVMAHLVEGI